ncbi:hypothetical protein Ndes2526B_g00655 [Nannochloris sp. 'desiccata']|nr:putative F-box protein SKIP5 [Chlorella desiccata (nom. nud.)]
MEQKTSSKLENIRPTKSRLKSILDLDDACLIHVFGLLNPLPDLFSAARSCKRFRDLVHTRRSWLVVTTPTSDDITAPSLASGIAQEYRQQFTSLHDAIAFSRPGDTILLEPGVHEASNLVISHPLQLIGDGSFPDSSTLHCCSAIDSGTSRSSLAAPVLSFAATAGRVSHLAIEGGIGGCIAHYKGRLAIEECSLRCDARGLEHLAAPLVSFACNSRNISVNNSVVSTLPTDGVGVEVEVEVNAEVGRAEKSDIFNNEEDRKGGGGEHEAVVDIFNAKPVPSLPGTKEEHINEEEEEEENHPNRLPLSLRNAEASFSSRSCGSAPPPIGPGVVSVIGCTMQGGSTAVQVKGTGAVESVRVIYEAHKALFWFDVDSNAGQGKGQKRGNVDFGESDPSSPFFSISVHEQEESRDACAAVSTRQFILPSWMENKLAAEFDPRALQAQVAAVANT